MKIGVLGGTFNPIHNGHIEMARQALSMAGLDEVWIMPAKIPPHKDSRQVCSAAHRFYMCELACKDLEGVVVSQFEFNSDHNNYTYQTLEKLRLEYPDHEFYFIMGQDSVESFENWKNPQIILNNATLLVFLRGSHYAEEKQRCLDTIDYLLKKFEGNIISVDYEPDNCSSTEIRNAFYNDDKTFDFASKLSKDVYDYILMHRLYDKLEEYDIDSFKKELEQKLKPSRFLHCLGVAETAEHLAYEYDYPKDIAYVAGLLHDCAKYMSAKELLSYAKEHDIEVLEGDIKAPHLLHAPVGAYMAKHVFGINDPEICHSILVHTTGCPNMSLLDKIIFVADYIEPNRDKAPRLDELRKQSDYDIDKVIVMILEDTISYIKSQGAFMDLRTLDTYNYYKGEKK